MPCLSPGPHRQGYSGSQWTPCFVSHSASSVVWESSRTRRCGVEPDIFRDPGLRNRRENWTKVNRFFKFLHALTSSILGCVQHTTNTHPSISALTLPVLFRYYFLLSTLLVDDDPTYDGMFVLPEALGKESLVPAGFSQGPSVI